MNNMFTRLTSINWNKEAIRKGLQNDEMVALYKKVLATRELARTKTNRADYDEFHYNIEVIGDYCRLYMQENGKYYVFYNNMCDDEKNKTKTVGYADKIFQAKFKELNGLGLQAAFGYSDKCIKRCIPKQFSFCNKKFINQVVRASSIDASSQYPSGCLGLLPDAHDSVWVQGCVKPTAEYPFAFYASGHVAIYNELDTHEWLDSPFRNELFRFGTDYYDLHIVPKEKEETILMKASQYTMDSTWQYFYNIKENALNEEEYEKAKLVMNKTIGCWHKKDKDKKIAFTYDDKGSFQLAHIVAVAIARGNQKILNKVNEIAPLFPLYSILHICVDGIIYKGDGVYGQDKKELGKFKQEFTNCEFLMKGTNVYCAMSNNKCVKFKHASYDLLYNKEIPDNKEDFKIADLDYLGKKERMSDLING